MIANSLSAMWAAIAPPLGNHLWQSTLFAITAGLLTLMLRRNYARARYWLWLASSVKFLIPFSLLTSIGSHLAWLRGSARAKAGLYFAMEEVGQPFTPRMIPVISQATPSTVCPSLIHLLPAVLAAVWLCGFVLVLSVWYVRWRRISAVIREAAPLREGREAEALRRLECIGGIRKRVEMVSSRASLEPGIFGIARPVLVWPEGISERLEDAHVKAILAHELWHVRCRDNLAAAIHMLVEAIFWFHPLVWWLGTRLVAERERSCDEEVLRLGNPPQVYAESILKTCEFCVESPLACLSGITGSDLRKRIVRIMTQRMAEKLSLGRKLLLVTIAIAAVAGPLIFGLLNAPKVRGQSPQTTGAPLPSFEVASVKPNRSRDNGLRIIRPSGLASAGMGGRFTLTNVTTRLLIEFAYDVKDDQLSGGPNWINSDKYDINAKVEDSLVDQARKLTFDQREEQVKLMVQSLLAERFQLKVSHATKELPVYALVVAKNGPKFSQTTVTSPGEGPVIRMGKRQLTMTGVPTSSLANELSRQLGRTVLDMTGLTGKYDFTLQWTPASQAPMFNGTDGGQRGPDNTPLPDSSGPSIFTAIQEQLGLKLESQKGPVEVIVIDHVEKPSDN